METQYTQAFYLHPNPRSSDRGNVNRGDTFFHSLLSSPARRRSPQRHNIPRPFISNPPLSCQRGNVTSGDTLSHSLFSPPAFSHSSIVTRGDTIFPGLLSPPRTFPPPPAAAATDHQRLASLQRPSPSGLRSFRPCITLRHIEARGPGVHRHGPPLGPAGGNGGGPSLLASNEDHCTLLCHGVCSRDPSCRGRIPLCLASSKDQTPPGIHLIGSNASTTAHQPPQAEPSTNVYPCDCGLY